MSGDISDVWKKASAMPIYKKVPKEDTENYRPVSLTLVPGKVTEVLLETTTNQMKQVIGKKQYRFSKGKSHHTNLTTFYNNTSSSVNMERAVDVWMLFTQTSAKHSSHPH